MRAYVCRVAFCSFTKSQKTNTEIDGHDSLSSEDVVRTKWKREAIALAICTAANATDECELMPAGSTVMHAENIMMQAGVPYGASTTSCCPKGELPTGESV
jgi:hypothetical protein